MRATDDQPRRSPTIEVVAKHAGVSIATVSRVLNGTGQVSPAVEERVRASVKELGYVPNHVARSLKARRIQQIALAIADIGNPVYVAMAKAIQTAAQARGYRVLLLSTDAQIDEEIAVLQSLKRQYVDGLILSPIRITPGHVQQLQTAAAPVVVIGSLPDDVPVDNVRVDSARGVELAISHLIGQGLSRIAFINGPTDTVPGGSRLRGYQATLLNHGLPFDPDLVVSGNFMISGGYTAVGQLLERKQRPDAIFCANDLMALGAMRRLREEGLRVPHDVALVGMDDIDQTTISTPTLTSVSLMAAERGRIAAEMLLGRIDGDRAEPHRVTLLPRLVVRESSVILTGG